MAKFKQESYEKNLYKLKKIIRVSRKKKLDSIFTNSYKELEKMQIEYDSETKHSTNLSKQEIWNVKIERMLDSLKEYIK